MIHGRIPPPRGSRSSEAGKKTYRDRMFLMRLLSGLSLGLAGCLLVFLIPALYFVEQNYGTFMQLAYDVRPGLIQHLEREVIWLRGFLFFGLCATAAVCFFFGRRLLNQLLEPLDDVEDHLRSLTRGDWTKAPPEIPNGDADRSFFLTYEYFHRSLRAGAEAELKMLERIVVDPAHRESYSLWKTLIASQRARLGKTGEEVSDSSEGSSEVRPLHRVS